MLLMPEKIRKVKQYCKMLNGLRFKKLDQPLSVRALPCEYKKNNVLPSPEAMLPFASGDLWGEHPDGHAWFYLDLPPVGENVYLKVETDRNGWDAENPQFIAYVNGKIAQGLDTNHRELLLPAGIPLSIHLYAYTGPRIAHLRFFASLLSQNKDVDGLYYDILYPLEMLTYLDGESDEYAKILDYLFRAVSLLAWYDPASEDFAASVKEARRYLAEEFYGKYCKEQNTTVAAIGHTHIDCAWKWTLGQTREKVQRSFGTVLELMKEYPEYKFMSSQPLLYKDLLEEAPELFDEVKERVKEGRWECEGAMWVEPDCNLTSGESLVRQLIYGKRFFREHFGVESRVLWLPDVFGYSAALPQILRKSGVDWFVTSKISWNDVDRMPYDTFLWKGIDGTKINAHFLTAQDDKGTPTTTGVTYNGKTNSPMISGTYKRYQQKDVSSEALLTFGFGDGGGGPTREQLELARRGAYGIPGSPNVRIEKAGDFLSRLEKNMEGNRNVPEWQGELYLEYHRGTYTTQDANKKSNRRSEFLYEKAEALSVYGQKTFGLPSAKADLRRGWETILTNQFHDILPGSSITPVYEDSAVAYEEVRAIGEAAAKQVTDRVAASLGKEDGTLVWNATSFPAKGTLTLDGKTVETEDVIPSHGYRIVKDFKSTNGVVISDDKKKVETDRLTVLFNDDGQITSIYDKKADRELLEDGEKCEIRVYPDNPDTYDAWEWQSYERDEYRVLSKPASVTVADDGIRKRIRIEYLWGKGSRVVEDVFFRDGAPRVDFEVSMHWEEKHQMVKATFPTSINADKATFEIQFGNLERPTHFNTSWDRARFETCAHKYVDLSDGGYGVSLINDCKYGHDIHGSLIQLSLHRSPSNPHAHSGEGDFSMAYSLLLHEGSLRDSTTLRDAYLLNQPMTAIAGTAKKTALPESFSLVSVDRENVVIETVKEAEDSDATVIRMYEAMNCRESVNVRLGIPAKKVFLCDLLEREIEEIPVENGCFKAKIGGFEILTFKVIGA